MDVTFKIVTKLACTIYLLFIYLLLLIYLLFIYYLPIL